LVHPANRRARRSTLKSVARKIRFVVSDQADLGRPDVAPKKIRLALRRSRVFTSPSRLDQEGRIAIVTDVERGMRWTPATSDDE
jgi:hypothetical protein